MVASLRRFWFPASADWNVRISSAARSVDGDVMCFTSEYFPPPPEPLTTGYLWEKSAQGAKSCMSAFSCVALEVFSSAFPAELGRYFVQSTRLTGWPHLDKTQGSGYIKRILWFTDGIRAMVALGHCYVVVCMSFMARLRSWKCRVYSTLGRNVMVFSTSSAYAGVERRCWLSCSRSWYYLMHRSRI